jgi:hypothetical protein
MIWGSYEIGFDFIRWHPNPHLEMSADEQYEQNMKNDVCFCILKNFSTPGSAIKVRGALF